MRQLQPVAGPYGPDQPAGQDRWFHARRPRDGALLLRSAQAGRSVRGLFEWGQRPLASQRDQFLAWLSEGRTQRPANHSRHPVGHPGAVGGVRTKTTIRLVRGGDGLSHRQRRVGAQHRPAGKVERVVVRPGRQDLLLYGQGQHYLPHHHLARRIDGRRPSLRRRSNQDAEPAL